MARTVQECNNLIVTNLVTEFANIGITINPTLWSNRNLLRAICYTVAICQSVSEQYYDLAIAKMQAIQNISCASSALWLQNACFQFQYDSTTPQNLQIINNVPQYPIINDTLKIITACSVSTSLSNQVNIKVAKSNPLTVLTSNEIQSLQSYINQKGTAGINYIVSSANPDKLYLQADIYFNGQYGAVIKTNVVNALNTFLQNLSTKNFDGAIYISDIETFVKSIEGVNDIVINRLSVRADNQTLFNGVDMVLNSDWLVRKYNTIAGYAIQENTTANTFNDTLNFIAG